MFSPIAIAIVTVFMVPSPSSSHAHPVHELHVTATRLAFEPSIIRILAGEPVRLVICSGDAVHGVAMRDLNIDVQIPRGGATVIVEFTAPRAGRFQPRPEAVGPDVHLSMGGKLSRSGPQRSGSHVKYPHTNPVVTPPPPARIGERSCVATFFKSAAPSSWFDPEPLLK